MNGFSQFGNQLDGSKGVVHLPFNFVTRAWSVRRSGLLMKHGGFDHRPFLLCGNASPEWLQRRLRVIDLLKGA